MGSDGTVLELVTRCASEDEFVERFARFTTETDVVVPALPHVNVGFTGRFAIRLQDHSVIMSGRCEVTEVLPLPAAPGAPIRSARALMRLRLIEMDAHTCGIHLRLTARRSASVKSPDAPAPEPAPPRPPAAPSLSIVRTPPPLPRPVMAAAPPPPVRNALAMQTLIGVPATLGLPATLGMSAGIVAAAVVATESEPTLVSPAREETRVPGAALTLPANPLSDLDAADLGSFIEHTLLEAQGVVDSAAVISTPMAGERSQANQDRVSQAPAPPAARPQDRVERARRIARRVGPYVAGALGGLVLGLLLRSGPSAAPVVVPPKLVSPSEIAPPPTPAAVPPAPEGETRTGARRDCVAQVTTRPAGAAILWGDVALGSSPIAHAAIPCGRASVTFQHERYSDVTRVITAERGQNAIVSERLSRPPAKVLVTSSPPNALIKLNRHAFGSAPRRIGTLRFERVRIEASLPGYQPWAKTLYLKEPETKVDITLTPIPKPKVVRRVAAPPVPASRK